jgi:hypothetical protein
MKHPNIHRERRKRTVNGPASTQDQHKAEAMEKVRARKASIGLPAHMRVMRNPNGTDAPQGRRAAKGT